jgi:hypothetical protein
MVGSSGLFFHWKRRYRRGQVRRKCELVPTVNQQIYQQAAGQCACKIRRFQARTLTECAGIPSGARAQLSLHGKIKISASPQTEELAVVTALLKPSCA